MTQELQPVELTVVDTNTAVWVGSPIPQLGVDLELIPLVDDPDTGMQVMKVVYRAGLTTVWHTHPCARGIYVLEGTLRTHQGEYEAMWQTSFDAPSGRLGDRRQVTQ